MKIYEIYVDDDRQLVSCKNDYDAFTEAENMLHDLYDCGAVELDEEQLKDLYLSGYYYSDEVLSIIKESGLEEEYSNLIELIQEEE